MIPPMAQRRAVSRPSAKPTPAAMPTAVAGRSFTKVSACVATGAQELQLLLVVAISTLPALLWVLRRRPSTTRSTGSSRHGPEPPLSPVDKRVLLLE